LRNLHDNLVLEDCIFLTKAVPSWLQAFAVATPSSIEFNKDVLIVIEHDLLEGLSNDSVDGLILEFGNWLALERRLKVASEVLLDPCQNKIRGKFLGLIKRVLELLRKILDNKGRPVGLHEIESATVVTEFDGVNGDKIHLGLEFLGNGSDGFNLFVLILGRRVDKEIGKRFRAGGVDGIVLATDFVNDRNGELLHPVGDVIGLEVGDRVGEFALGFIETAVNNQGRRLDASGVCKSLVSRETEKVVIAMLFRGSTEDRSRL